MTLTVSQVARATGISVRTLHHYDEIGLVRPSGRSGAGYRLYAPADLERLQRVLFYRELSMPLEEIARILDDATVDVREALRTQRQMLIDGIERSRALVAAVDAAIARIDRGEAMTTEDEIRAAFGEFDPTKYEAEARERWGDTPAFAESQRRTKRYTKDDWQLIRREGDEIYSRLAALLELGTPPSDAAAMDAAEAHRRHIDRWFYPCSRAMHRGLGEMYVQDSRFQATLDGIREGLAAYACAAFDANAARE
ncbi:MAG TPA: MerR family transcriptional regulator [Nannocystaceae bacterium]|nr:MerR family transcriptional regulator [Nannocystaceae bacterium]